MDKTGFAKDTAFIGHENLADPAFKKLKDLYQGDTIFHGETDDLKGILLLRRWIHQTIPIDNAGPYPGQEVRESIHYEALEWNRGQ